MCCVICNVVSAMYVTSLFFSFLKCTGLGAILEQLSRILKRAHQGMHLSNTHKQYCVWERKEQLLQDGTLRGMLCDIDGRVYYLTDKITSS